MNRKLLASASMLAALLACSSSSKQSTQPATAAPAITGRVTIAGATDASGVVVSAIGPRTAAAATDATGAYRLEGLAGGAYVLQATAPGTAEGSVGATVTVPGTGTVEGPALAFTAVGEVHGTVTLGQASGNGGIAVVVAGTSASAVTDDAGAYAIAGVPAGARTLVFSRQGYVGATAPGVVVTRGGRTPVDPVVLSPAVATGAIHGRALVPGAASLAGIAVTLSGPVAGGAVTDASGAYAFGALPDGDYLVLLAAPSTAEGTRTVQVRVSGGAAATAPDASFSALGAVSGTATLGSAAGNAGIAVAVPGTGAVGVTDDAGAYVIRGVPAGARQVSATMPGYVTASADVTVAWNASAVAPTLQLARAVSPGRIHGVAALTGAASSEPVTVTLTGPVTAATTAAADGSYAFSGLPDGGYTVTAVAASTTEGAVSAPVTVAGGADVAAPGLSLTAVGTITGRVTLAGAQTGNAGTVVAVAGLSVAGFTDDAGYYEIRGVPAGAHGLVASHAGYRSASLDGVWVGYAALALATELSLAVGGPETEQIAGRVHLVGATRLDGTVVSLDGTGLATTTDGTGAFAFPAVAAGAYALTASSGGFSETVPTVLALAGGTGFVVDGSLYPFGNLEIQRGQRIGTGTTWRETADRQWVVTQSGYTLTATPVAGGASRVLATDATGLYLVSSSHVVYATTGGASRAAPLAGGPAIELGASVGALSLAPDGHSLVYLTSGRLAVADLSDGTVTVTGVTTGWFQFTGSGAYVLFQGNASASPTLYAVTLATKAVNLLATGYYTYYLDGSGTKITTLTSQSGGLYAIALVPLDGGASIPLASNVQNWWTATPTRVLMLTNTGGSYAMILASTETGAVLASVATGTTSPGVFALSSNGDSWMYGVGPAAYVMSASYATPAPLPSGSSGSTGFTFSPGGAYALEQTLAWDSVSAKYTTTLYSFDVAARAVRTIYASAPSSSWSTFQYWQWSQDSKYLLATGNSDRSYVVFPLAGGTPVPLGTAYAASLTPDGARACWSASAPPYALTCIPSSGGASVSIAAATNGPFSLTPDSTRAIYQTGSTWLSGPVTGGASVTLGTSLSAFGYSPDMQTFAYISQTPSAGNLCTAPIAGGTPTCVDSSVLNYTFTQSSTHVVYTRADGGLAIVPVGGAPTQLAPAVRTWTFSPDATQVAFVGTDGSLGISPIASPSPTLLATGVDGTGALRFAPDSSRIGFVAGRVVCSVPVTGGAVTPHIRTTYFSYDWLDATHLIVVRTGSPAPYQFQDGLYLAPVP